MQRRRPDYKPDDLKEGIRQLDVNIDRLQKTIDDLKQRNEQLKQAISNNTGDIQIYTAEIGKLENQKVELSRLISEIERERRQAVGGG